MVTTKTSPTKPGASTEAVKQIAVLDDIRAVGPLADALELDAKSIRTVARKALTRLLPRLQASDAHLLNADQRASLHRALKSKDEEFVIAALKAYEQVGDEKALPYVERLAEGYYNFRLTERLRLSFHFQHVIDTPIDAARFRYILPGVRLQASF